MSQEELQRVVQACELVLSLDKAKKVLTEYVQSRMNIFAPNLTALIGSLTAAQLLNAAGGLAGLAKTPACNLPAWGSKKQANAALATNMWNSAARLHLPLAGGAERSKRPEETGNAHVRKQNRAVRAYRLHASLRRWVGR